MARDLTPQETPSLVDFKTTLAKLMDAGELKALPSSVEPEAFRNAAIVAVTDNPRILKCTMQSVFKAIRDLANAGLVPDGREAAMVPFRTNGIDLCQAMPMVFGIIKTARNSGQVKAIRAHVVYQAEIDQGRFTYLLGDEERIEHDPILFGDRGAPVGAYAIAELTNGGIERCFMSAEDIDRVRRSSPQQRGKDQPEGIWAQWWDQMWLKTVIRRLSKRLPLSSGDLNRIMVEPDFDHMRNVTPQATTRRGVMERIQDKAKEQPQDDPDDAVSGEVVEPFDIGKLNLLKVDQSAPAFNDGEMAFMQGQPLDACPYWPDDLKAAAAWVVGWQTQEKAQ